MFLITTADERYWDTSEKILFLGNWCKRYDRRHVWSKLVAETLPYHWDDRERLYRDHQFLRDVYECRLRLLAGQLDLLHGETHSIRYWRMIIGPWLRHFVEDLYDRYLSIDAAFQSGKVTATLIAPATIADWVPLNLITFLKRSWDDPWNQYLYGRIISSIEGMPWKIAADIAPPSNLALGTTNMSSPLRRIARKMLSSVPDAFNRVVLVSSHLGRWQQTRLQLALGQIPYLVSPQIEPEDETPDAAARRKLTDGPSSTPFERLLNNLIPEQIPLAYVEAYPGMRERALDAFPKKPRVILSANAFYDNEGFKIWAAHQTETGTKFCALQHGGHYGMGLWSSFDEHELAISDRYYTWGWKTEAANKECRPLSGGSLIRSKKSLKARGSGGILWATMALPRYMYGFYSVPVGPQVQSYFDDQKRFAAAVSPAVMELLQLRLYPHDYGWQAYDRMHDAIPELNIYRGPMPFIKQLNESRLYVGTYNSTTFLETFVADYPTVVFWNPAHWELRPSAQPAFDDLRLAGILHDTPEAAAAKVNEIHHDPSRWWRQPAVQEAKNRFCARFAMVRDDWINEWKLEFKQ
jgi:putative transferase (TIGR04331 family)